MRNFLIAAFLGWLALLAIACSGDKKHDPKEPEIISSQSGSSSSTGTRSGGSSSVQIVSVGSGGSTFLSVGPYVAPFTSAAPGTTPQGLTVRHTEVGTVKADDAYVLAQLTSRPPGPGGPASTLASRDQAAIVTALEALGVKKADINFDSSLNYGPFPTISVHVPVQDLATNGKKVSDAIESVVGRSSTGLRFGLKDCSAGLGAVRQKAFAGARASAEAFARQSSLSTGPVVAVSESLGSSASGPVSDPCNPLSNVNGPVGNLLPFEAEPEVRVRLEVAVTLALTGAAAADTALTTSGTGKVTAKADEAYIVVSVQSVSGPFGSQPISSKNRDELLKRLKALKLNDDDIEISSDLNGSTIVSVETGVKDLVKLGDDVTRAVEDGLQVRSTAQGVRFSHSNCEAVLAEARKQALTDAKRSADALAGVASLKLGQLVALSEPAVGSVPYPARPANGCNEDFTSVQGIYGAQLKSFDSEPEFTVSTVLTATYAIGGP